MFQGDRVLYFTWLLLFFNSLLFHGRFTAILATVAISAFQIVPADDLMRLFLFFLEKHFLSSFQISSAFLFIYSFLYLSHLENVFYTFFSFFSLPIFPLSCWAFFSVELGTFYSSKDIMLTKNRLYFHKRLLFFLQRKQTMPIFSYVFFLHGRKQFFTFGLNCLHLDRNIWILYLAFFMKKWNVNINFLISDFSLRISSFLSSQIYGHFCKQNRRNKFKVSINMLWDITSRLCKKYCKQILENTKWQQATSCQTQLWNSRYRRTRHDIHRKMFQISFFSAFFSIFYFSCKSITKVLAVEFCQ